MIQWEYCTRNLDNVDFQSLGLNGWELVSVVITQFHGQYFYFKRPIEFNSVKP
jgi:hypothetical protein